MKIRRLPDGLLDQRSATSTTVTTRRRQPTKFYALTTDVQVEFDVSGPKKQALAVTVGEDSAQPVHWEKVSLPARPIPRLDLPDRL